MNSGFIRLRRGLFEHLLDGRMNGDELAVYTTLHFMADYETGMVARVSAPYLSRYTLHMKVDKVKRILASLDRKNYIKRFNHRGQISYYPVLINNFKTPNNLILRADKTLSLNEIVFSLDLNYALIGTYDNFNDTLKEFKCSVIQEVKNIRTKEIKNKRVESVSGEIEEEFNKFWNYYGKHGNRKEAFSKWKKLTKKQKQEIRVVLPEYIKSTNTDGTYPGRKNAETYLNKDKEYWKDNIIKTKTGAIAANATDGYKDLSTMHTDNNLFNQIPEEA